MIRQQSPKYDYGMIAHIVSWGNTVDRICGIGLVIPESVPYQWYSRVQFRILKWLSVFYFDVNTDFRILYFKKLLFIIIGCLAATEKLKV